MPVAVVCAAFDPVADAAVERVREQVEQAGQRVRRGHRPHFTLTAARVDDPDEVIVATAALAARHGPIDVTMDRMDSFASGVLFVGAAESVALRELQRDAYETMSERWPPAFGEQSAPGAWIPHCTLATRLWRRDLRALCDLPFARFPATVDALAVILVGGRGDVARLPLGPPHSAT